jgi:hypothetical protein
MKLCGDSLSVSILVIGEHLLYQNFKNDKVLSYKLKDTTSAEWGNKDFTGNLAWYFPLETDAVIVVKKERNQFFESDSPSSNTEHSVGRHSFHSPCNSLASDVELTVSVLLQERQNA